jgi:hypothetical protein
VTDNGCVDPFDGKSDSSAGVSGMYGTKGEGSIECPAAGVSEERRNTGWRSVAREVDGSGWRREERRKVKSRPTSRSS